MHKIKIANGDLTLYKGDIAEVDIAAVVNAANTHFWMGSGVAGAIKKAAGQEVETEAMSLGPVDPGNVVVTSAGAMKADYIIHAAVMGQDLATNEDFIRSAVKNSLEKAEELKVDSLAIPALGTGVGAFSVYICANVILEECIDFLLKSVNLKHIHCVLFDDDTTKAFIERLDFLFHKH